MLHRCTSLQSPNVCTSFLNPRPDAAAFISPSDLAAFESSSSTPALNSHESCWTYPHILTLFIIPPLHEPRGRFTGPRKKTLLRGKKNGTLSSLEHGPRSEFLTQWNWGDNTRMYFLEAGLCHDREESKWVCVTHRQYAVEIWNSDQWIFTKHVSIRFF